MQLNKAYLCIDCDEVFETYGRPNACCPKCLSRSFAPVAGWITTQAMAERLATPRVEIVVEASQERGHTSRPEEFGGMSPQSIPIRPYEFQNLA
jgi:DNA-directed RNA polymerase subunit RPC12/RpoP